MHAEHAGAIGKSTKSKKNSTSTKASAVSNVPKTQAGVTAAVSKTVTNAITGKTQVSNNAIHNQFNQGWSAIPTYVNTNKQSTVSKPAATNPKQASIYSVPINTNGPTNTPQATPVPTQPTKKTTSKALDVQAVREAIKTGSPIDFTKRSTINAATSTSRIPQLNYKPSNILDTYKLDNVRYNTKFAVKTATVADAKVITKGISEGYIEQWFITDGNDMAAKSPVLEENNPTRTIGRDRLANIATDDEMIFYNTITGELYKYTRADSKYRTYESKREYSRNMLGTIDDSYGTKAALAVQKYEAKVDEYTNTINAGGTISQAQYDELMELYDAAQDLVGQYDNKRAFWLERYNYANDYLSAQTISQDEYSYYQYIEDKIATNKHDFHLTDAQAIRMLSPAEKAYKDKMDARIAEGTDIIVMNSDFQKQVDAQANALKINTQQYEEMRKYFSEYTSDTQVNSITDVIKRAYGRAVFNAEFEGDEAGKNKVQHTLRDIDELWYRTHDAAKDYAIKESALNKSLLDALAEGDALKDPGVYIKAATKDIFNYSKVQLSNTLVAIGEDLDWSNNFLKPIIIGNLMYGTRTDLGTYDSRYQNYSMRMDEAVAEGILDSESAGLDFLATTWGKYGTTPTTDYSDFMYTDGVPLDAFTNLVGTLFFEIVLDPMTWISFGGAEVGERVSKHAARSIQDELTESVARVYKAAGIDPAMGLSGAELKRFKELGALAVRNADEASEYAMLYRKSLNDMASKQIDQEVSAVVNRWAKAKGMSKTDLTNILEDVLNNSTKTHATSLATTHHGMVYSAELQDAISKSNKELYHIANRRAMSNINHAIKDVLTETAAKPINLSTSYLVAASLGNVSKINEKLTSVFKYADTPWLANVVMFSSFLEKQGFIDTSIMHAIKNVTAVPASRVHIAISRIIHKAADITGSVKTANDVMRRLTDLDEDYAMILREAADNDALIKATNEYMNAVNDTLIEDVLYKEFRPFERIMESTLDEADKITKLDALAKSVSEGRFNTFLEYLDNYSKYVGDSTIATKFGENNVDYIIRMQAKYNDVYAKTNLAKADRLITQNTVLANKLKLDFSEFDVAFNNVQSVLDGKHVPVQRLWDELNTAEDAVGVTLDALVNTPFKKQLGAPTTQLEQTVSNLQTTMREAADSLRAGDSIRARELMSVIAEPDGLLSQVDKYATEYTNQLTIKRANILDKMGRVDLSQAPKVAAKQTLEADKFTKSFADAFAAIEDLKITDADEFYKQVRESALVKDSVADLFKNGDTYTAYNDLTKVYELQLTKAVEQSILLNNPTLNELATDVLDPKGATNVFLRRVRADAPEEAQDAIDELMRAAAAFKTSSDFVNTIKTAEMTSDATRVAVLDGFAGSAGYINGRFASYNMRSINEREQFIRNTTQHILDKADRYLNGTVNDDAATWVYRGVHYNTLDTAENVRHIQEAFKDTKLMQHLELDDADKYIDVTFSMNMLNTGADPYMLSLGVGDEIRTFRNSDILYNIDNYTAQHAHGITVTNAQTQYANVCKNVKGFSRNDYINQIDDYLDYIYKRAAAEDKTVRFIGFNNSSVYTDQNRYLRKLIYQHNMGVHVSEIVDVGNAARAAKGIVSTSDVDFAEVERAVRTMVSDGTRASHIIGTQADVALGVEADFARIADRITTNTAEMSLGEMDRASMAHLAKNASQIEVSTRGVIKDTIGTVKGMHVNLEELNKLSAKYGGRGRVNAMEILRRMSDVDPEMLVDVNLKKMFDKYVLDEWMDTAELDTILKGMSSNATVASKLEVIQDIVTKLDRHLSDIHSPELIRAIDKDGTVFKDLYTVMYKDLISREGVYANARHLSDISVFEHLKLNTAEDYFAACYYLRTTYSKYYASNDTRLAKALDTYVATNNAVKDLDALQDAFLLIDPACADTLIYNRANLVDYTNSTKLITNKYTDELAPYIQFRETTTYLGNQQCDSIKSYLASKDAVYQINGAYTAKQRMQYTLFDNVAKPYINFVDTLNAQHTFAKFRDGALDKAIAAADYNKAAAALKDSVHSLQRTHNEAAVRAVLTADDDIFVAHLIRNCKNTLTIDPKWSVFTDSPNNTKLLIDRLKHIEEYNVKYADDIANGTALKIIVDDKAADGYIRIYCDLDAADDLAKARLMDSLFDKYSKADFSALSDAYYGVREVDSEAIARYANKYAFLKETAKNPRQLADRFEKLLEQAYEEGFDKEYMRAMVTNNVNAVDADFSRCIKGLDKYTTGDFITSNFETLSEATYKNLQEFFPESSHLKYERFNTWFDESYNCSMWGDFDMRSKFNPYSSDSIVNNIGNSLHHTRNKMEATTNYFYLFDNETQRLNFMLERITDGGKFTYKQLNEALDNSGYVLAQCVVDKQGHYTVEQVRIGSEHAFQRYKKADSLICISNEELISLQQYAKGINKEWSLEEANAVTRGMSGLLDLHYRTFRSARVTGWLFGTPFGAAFRNEVDATRKAVNQTGTVKVLDYIGAAMEYQKQYDDVLTALTREGKIPTAENIKLFFDTSSNQVGKLDYESFMKMHAFCSSDAVGLADTFSKQRALQTDKLLGLLQEDPRMAGIAAEDLTEYIETAKKTFQKVHNDEAYSIKRAWINKPLGESELQLRASKELREALKHAPLSNDQIEALADMYYHYTPNAANWGNALQESPVLGKYLTFNANMFGDVETSVRTGMAMYYMDELGMTANRANQEIIKSQFDYSNRSKFMDWVDRIFPFSTFKMCNAKYWLTESVGQYALKQSTKFARLEGYVIDSETEAEILRSYTTRYMMAQGLKDAYKTYESEDSDVTYEEYLNAYSSAITYAVENSGVPEDYAKGIRLKGSHYIKVGDSFVEAFDLVNSFAVAPMELAAGEVPSVISDNIYSPLATALQIIAAGHSTQHNLSVWDWEHNALGSNTVYDGSVGWTLSNLNSTHDLVPFVGTLYNYILTEVKSGYAGVQDLALLNLHARARQDYAYDMIQCAEDLGAFIAPSIIGRIRTNKQYDYYAPSYLTKDPVTYYNYAGMYKKLGFTDEQIYGDKAKGIKGILEYSFSGGISEDSPFYYNTAALNETLVELVARGFSAEEAMQMIVNTANVKWLWLDNETLLTKAQLTKEMQNSAFLKTYDKLPDYVKYDKNMLSDLIQYYRSQGYNYEALCAKIAKELPYIDEEGNLRYYTPEQAKAVANEMSNDYYEFSNQLPAYVRNEPGAISRTLNYIMEMKHISRERAMEYILKTGAYVFVGKDGEDVLEYVDAAEATIRNAKASKEFNEYYSKLPDYIRYEKGAFGRTKKYLKSIGFDEATAKKWIAAGAYYTNDGRLIDCTKLQRQRNVRGGGNFLSDEQWQEYFNSIPEYTKYESGGYKRTYSYLKAQGYSASDIRDMIQKGMFVTANGNLINVNELGLNNKDAYKRTEEYLKNMGYDATQIRALIESGAYVTTKGRLINIVESGIATRNPLMRDLEFRDYYNTIPEYTRYEKGAFSRTYAYLKAQGMSEDEIKEAIKNGAYLTADGKLINVLGMQRQRQQRTWTRRTWTRRTYRKRGGYNAYYHNKGYNRYFPRPKHRKAIKHYFKTPKLRKPYVTNKSYSGTYSLTNVLRGATYGWRKLYKISPGNTSVRKSLSIKSTYPAAYRNVVYSNRRNMYKEQYAKYGLSRMTMRSGGWKTYSNRSTVKLRREHVQNKMRYSSIRANF